MATIDVTDVETAIGRPISDSDELAQVEQWIGDVELLLGARIPDLSAMDQALLAYVVREAVIARMRYAADRNSGRTDNADESDSGEEHYFLRILGPWWSLLLPDSDTAATAYTIPVVSPLDVA